jgi:hypothetical protein
VVLRIREEHILKGMQKRLFWRIVRPKEEGKVEGCGKSSPNDLHNLSYNPHDYEER